MPTHYDTASKAGCLVIITGLLTINTGPPKLAFPLDPARRKLRLSNEGIQNIGVGGESFPGGAAAWQLLPGSQEDYDVAGPVYLGSPVDGGLVRYMVFTDSGV